jgi:pyruvate,water dikinase
MYESGFREGFARYGAMLDTIEYASIHGFVYIAPRPLGAPKDAKGPPPKLLLKLLCALHPALRGRIKQARRVLDERLWRVDRARYMDEERPRLEETLEAFGRRDLTKLTDAELAAHLDEIHRTVRSAIFDHFRYAAAAMLPVGDFVVHVVDWTGCSPSDAIALLNGSSPESLEALDVLGDLADAVRRDDEVRNLVAGSTPATEILAALPRRPPPVGPAAERWLARVGPRIVTGYDLLELTAGELPELLVATLRARMDDGARSAPAANGAASELRARVPEAHRAMFDELLAEARHAHVLRDARSVTDFWGLGLARVALCEAGRRLAEAGRIERPEHAFDLSAPDLLALLRGESRDVARELAKSAEWRASISTRDVPDVLGPPPGEPPPAEWLPAPAARIARAFTTYIDAMNAKSSKGAAAGPGVLRGVPAGGGRRVGTARVVLGPRDFGSVERGEILVARVTNPAYNILLPLLGGLVTDRGGALSHAAIVAREYGLPAVVGCGDATSRVRTGARLEIDGDRGTVAVLS